MYNDDEKLIEIHFYECWDDSVFITESELNEWFDEISDLVNDDSKTVEYRMQRLVAMITNE